VSFILRAVIILIIFAFVVFVLKAIARLSSRLRITIKDVQKLRDQMSGRATANAEMIRCVSCGAFVSARDAVTISSGNRAQVFCSRECIRAHVVS
jgi:hypothetical protein